MSMKPINELDFLHPVMLDRARSLLEDLRVGYKTGLTKTNFQVFETYRSPKRQRELIIAKTTKARPWQSAHQFGLALDIVPFGNLTADGTYETWSWAGHHDYTFLAVTAEKNGLSCPISWDKCHVQHPNWNKIKRAFEAYL